MMRLRLAGILLFVLALGACTEPPYINADNDDLA